MVAAQLKSKKAYRTIGIPAFLCEELAAHSAQYPSESDFVFSHAQGVQCRRRQNRCTDSPAPWHQPGADLNLTAVSPF